jgi:carboxyl-terminal processing protease
MAVVLGIVWLRYSQQMDHSDLAQYRWARDFITSSYVEAIDDREVLDRALHGAVDGLDGYSRYYDSEQVARLDRETSGVYRGIGVVFAPISPPGQVLFAQEGSPADEAGIQTADRIVSIDGRALDELSASELSQLVSGADEGGVEVAVSDPTGAVRTLAVVPVELIDPSVRHARLIAGGEPRIGYLAITSFSRKTPEELDAALAGLGELDALVIDVRGNPGGVLEAAVMAANRFVAEGMLVSHEGRGTVVEFRARPEEATRAGLPLAVLVDGYSASASEVFAAALQDHRAAVLVGTATYGKGVVQEVRHFGQARAVVKLTTAYYYTPAGRNLERTVENAGYNGIQPDLWVELEDGEALSVAQHLASHAAPPAALPRLRAWEQELGVQLVPSHPPDRQLEAALALLRGERPGAWRTGAESAPGEERGQ